jgi:hypothetical protein
MPYSPSDPSSVQSAIDLAQRTVEFANRERTSMRKTIKPGPEREKRIEKAIEEINRAMKPLRSLIGISTWEPLPDDLEDQIRSASTGLQYERKQLKKMLYDPRKRRARRAALLRVH